ncbi:MAG: MarR family transcriptional regulator [Clostridiaceae bacterium]|nr:MarR family transcriptional regulator [Clostridiaceae bacterium]
MHNNQIQPDMRAQRQNEDLLAALDRLMRLLRRRPVQGHGGRGTYRILKILSGGQGIPTRELAVQLDMRSASLNEKLAVMEQAGLIRRYRGQNDQRVFMATIEPAGQAWLNTLRAERVKTMHRIGDSLTKEEIQQLTDLANKLGEGLAGDSPAGEPPWK